MQDTHKVLIIGCGDIGVRVARLELEQGSSVAGLVRSAAGAERLRDFGIEPVAGDLDDPDALGTLPTAGRRIYYCAPPPGGGPWDSRVRNFCAAVDRARAPARVVYLSTSGVYGDCGGAWVNEDTPVNPQTTRAKRRLDAETVLGGWCRQLQVPLVILRVTGIYGPGRLPLARLREGHPVLCEADSPPTNRIHADDLAAVCIAAAEQGADGEIFNVSDGQPGTMTQYFNTAADLLGLPRPPQVSMAEARRVMAPTMLSYLTETRRMGNRKMLERLGVVLRYPDLQSGLQDVVARLDSPHMGYLGGTGH